MSELTFLTTLVSILNLARCTDRHCVMVDLKKVRTRIRRVHEHSTEATVARSAGSHQERLIAVYTSQDNKNSYSPKGHGEPVRIQGWKVAWAPPYLIPLFPHLTFFPPNFSPARSHIAKRTKHGVQCKESITCLHKILR